uniref:Uncharacterized protein n=1 Tax=Vibrio phage P018-4 TaxID=3229728 RepID=A0AB39AJB2_9CAUD
MKESKLVQIPFDTGWMDDKGYRTLPYKSDVYIPNEELTVRGSEKSYMKIPMRYVDNIQELAKGFLFGSLYKSGLTLDEVVFFPADTVKHSTEKGEPVYIFVKDDHFELESWFARSSILNATISTSVEK